MSELKVSRADTLDGLEKLAADLDRLNALSDRPNPFLSAQFLRNYCLHTEYRVRGDVECLYCVRNEEGRIIGIAPMRRSVDNLTPGPGPLRLRGVRLQVLAPWDTESPGILAAPEDADPVTAALLAHWSHERDWGMLEFVGQSRGSPLHVALHAASGRSFRARDVEVEPYTQIDINWTDLAHYFRSLAKKMRSNISRQARRLLAHGEVQVVLAEGPQAVSAWFGAYLDLDGRSWKHGTGSSICRDPRRVRFYEEFAGGRGGLRPSFIGIVLDGVLTAALLTGSNSNISPDNHGAWCLEMAYDQSQAELGPGQLLLLLATGEALGRGARFVNFMQNFAYYKHRWGARLLPVVNVQLLRRGSLHNVRATIGEWVNSRKARRRAGDAAVPEAGAAVASDAELKVVAARTADDLASARDSTRAALAFGGHGVRVLHREQLRTYLPFDIETA